MPGKSPEEAIDNFIGFISETLSCITSAQLIGHHQKSDNIYKLLFRDSACVNSYAGKKFYIFVTQAFTVKKCEGGLFKVHTLQYSYVFTDSKKPTTKGILAYHWHPDDFNLRDPHLHLHITPETGYPEIERLIAKAHFPTSRVCLEDFALLLIKYYKIKPALADSKWKPILKKNKNAFSQMATWFVKPQ